MTSSTFDLAALTQKSTDLGFTSLGITAAHTAESTQDALKRFIANKWQGDMHWMAETAARRLTPRNMWPDARSAIMLSANYTPPHNPLEDLGLTDRGNISVYARNKDYHDVLKKRLKQLARWIAEESGGQVKVFVDTAPLMEKPLAAQAGLGWQGKHTNLVSRDYGSWLFLGAILTDLDLPTSSPEVDHCGSCQACLDVCPTQAFPAPYQLDARRCISYLTIEYKGHIPPEFRRPMGNRIYGCDDCLAVCPWNKFAQTSAEIAFHARPELTAPYLSDLLGLDDAGFREVFSANPIKRIGRDRFVRNCLIAAGNSGDAGLVGAVASLLHDPAAIVRAMAVWALKELLDSAAFLEATAALHQTETDDAVLAELAGGDAPTTAQS